jgi:MOSC domain-containing protein YiiM
MNAARPLTISEIVSIQLGPVSVEPTLVVPEILVVAGRGIEGDRFFKQAGTYSGVGLGKEITLISEEALSAAERESGIEVSFPETRRNLLVRGVALNDLIGREFEIGGVLLRGVRECAPCKKLADRTGKPLLRMLAGRGGLMATVLRGGFIGVGAEVSLPAPLP